MRLLSSALDGLLRVDHTVVEAVAEAQLLHSLDLLWRNGWQPAEIVRHARRQDARAGRLVAIAVVADHVLRPTSTLHPRWEDQVTALETPPVEAPTGWLRVFADHELVHRVRLIETVLAALRAVCGVGPVHEELPPPGDGARRTAAPDSHVDGSILAKVRALLAQAESTTFEAEAEAFTAKAEELMARHAIDEALVWAASSRADGPTSTLPIDDPYADAKSLLLHIVAKHTRCKAVWTVRYGWSTVVGFPADVAATELLFTSLLVQSATVLQVEAARSGPGGRTRSRSFKSSFLRAYAHRIDARLAAVAAAAEAAADDGSSTLLPALAARHDAVEAELVPSSATCGRTRSAALTIPRAGRCGTLAADLAKLNTGEVRSGAA